MLSYVIFVVIRIKYKYEIRCSVVAAANPVKGHYNKAKTVSENLKMSGPLLSRFDLVYILLDTPNQIKDKFVLYFSYVYE